MKFMLIPGLALAALSVTSAASADPTNLLACDLSGSFATSCALSTGTLAQSALLDGVKVESTYELDYDFACAPGATNVLDIVATAGGDSVPLAFGQSGKAIVTGSGNLRLVDNSPDKTLYSLFVKSCHLIITNVPVGNPTATAVYTALDALKTQATSLARLVAKESVLNASYVGDEHASTCAVVFIYRGLADQLFGIGSKPTPTQLVDPSAGGDTAASMVEESIDAAASVGALTIPSGQDGFAYFSANFADIMTNEPACDAEAAAEKSPSATPGSQPTTLSLPNEAACGSNVSCKSNAKDYLADENTLATIVHQASSLRDQAASLPDDQWVTDTSTLISSN